MPVLKTFQGMVVVFKLRVVFCSAARENLNNVRFQGKTMRVSTSKHDRISMPKKDGEVCALKEDVCKY